MWWDQELADLKSTVLSDTSLEDFLTSYEIDIIKENSTRYRNLTNGLFVPGHKERVSSLLRFLKRNKTFQRLKLYS